MFAHLSGRDCNCLSRLRWYVSRLLTPFLRCFQSICSLGSQKHFQILYDIKGFRPRLPCRLAPIKLYIVFLAVCILGFMLNLLNLSNPMASVLCYCSFLFYPLLCPTVMLVRWVDVYDFCWICNFCLRYF